MKLLVVLFCTTLFCEGTLAGMGVSYHQIMQGLSTDFSMQKVAPVDAKECYEGSEKNRQALLQLVGTENDLLKATFSINIPQNNPDITMHLTGLLLTFLANILPEWKDRAHWVDNALSELRKVESDQSITITRQGKKIITMELTKSSANIKIAVEEDNL